MMMMMINYKHHIRQRNVTIVLINTCSEFAFILWVYARKIFTKWRP